VGETDELGGILPQCYLVHQMSHMTWDRTRAAKVGTWLITACAMIHRGTHKSLTSALQNSRVIFKGEFNCILFPKKVWFEGTTPASAHMDGFQGGIRVRCTSVYSVFPARADDNSNWDQYTRIKFVGSSILGLYRIAQLGF
jgi:hypothetical protein